SHAKEFGDVEAFFHVADKLQRSSRTLLQKVIAWANPGSSGESTRCIGRGLQSKLLCCVGVEQIRIQQAFFDHDRAARRNTLTVERARAEASDDGAVINDRHIGCRDQLAKLSSKKRRAAVNGIAVHTFEQMLQ